MNTGYGDDALRRIQRCKIKRRPRVEPCDLVPVDNAPTKRVFA